MGKDGKVVKGIKNRLLLAVALILVPLVFLLVFFAAFYNGLKSGLLTALLTLAAVCIGCAVTLLVKSTLPFIKSLRLLEETRQARLAKNEDNTQIVQSLRESGPVGELIAETATRINVEPRARMLGAEVALYALQSQINPHFLYNTLDTIRNYAINNEVPEVAEMTKSLASIFRYSISRPGEVASLADEIRNVKAYLKIQWYRFSDRFSIVWDIDEEDDEIMKYSLPVLTLQPLVENAIQHGLENKMEDGVITIHATTTNTKLFISIEDNGDGIAAEKLDEIREMLDNYEYESGSLKRSNAKKAGISLNNVNQRLKLYYGVEGGLTVNSIEGVGTTVEIVIPKI